MSWTSEDTYNARIMASLAPPSHPSLLPTNDSFEENSNAPEETVNHWPRKFTHLYPLTVPGPIQRLPVEILEKVFLAAVDAVLSESIPHHRFLCSLTRVCRLWNSVARNFPELWTKVPIYNSTWTARALTLSSPMPLSIEVFPCTQWSFVSLSHTFAHTDRISRIEIPMNCWDLLWTLGMPDLPVLAELSLFVGGNWDNDQEPYDAWTEMLFGPEHYDNDTDTDTADDEDISVDDADEDQDEDEDEEDEEKEEMNKQIGVPNLRALHLECVSLSRSITSLLRAPLTVLTANTCKLWRTDLDLVRRLQLLPVLEELRIKDPFTPIIYIHDILFPDADVHTTALASPPSYTPCVTLDRLRLLVLDAPVPVLENVLSVVHFPPFTTVELHCDYDPDMCVSTLRDLPLWKGTTPETPYDALSIEYAPMAKPEVEPACDPCARSRHSQQTECNTLTFRVGYSALGGPSSVSSPLSSSSTPETGNLPLSLSLRIPTALDRPALQVKLFSAFRAALAGVHSLSIEHELGRMPDLWRWFSRRWGGRLREIRATGCAVEGVVLFLTEEKVTQEKGVLQGLEKVELKGNGGTGVKVLYRAGIWT